MARSDGYSVRRAALSDIERYADDLGLSLSPEELEDYLDLVNGSLESYDQVLEADTPAISYRKIEYTNRPGGRSPRSDEDPLNSWIHRFELEGADGGSLDGVDIGIKDSIAVAGYPMTLGSEVLNGFVPQIDATVVERLLEAGATITGKQNMESFAFSGSGGTSDFGPVLNPYSEDHLAGGSSSGSAAAVANGDCDVSIGTDQAGSVRIPSACCGTVGLKPTTGLVPYTGALSLDLGIDHLGPIAQTVSDVARTLEVMAGEDRVDGVRMDPRQPRGIEGGAYADMLPGSLTGKSIGVLEEGFTWPFADEDVIECIRNAVDTLSSGGASTDSVSMDRHHLVSSAAGVISTIGGARTFAEAGVGRGPDGWYWTEFTDMFDSLKEARADALPPSVKQAILTAEHVLGQRGMTPYTIAQNIALEAEKEYDRLLADHDVLALPTIVIPPMTHDPEMDRVEATAREWMLAANTAPMDLTGHPAISVPCGMVDGLPTGMMFVGSHFDESTVLEVADGFESLMD